MLRLALGALALLLAAPAQAQFIDDLPHLGAEAEEVDAPPAEAIQVHGRWTITVREPDGALAEERVFQNALTINGAQALARVILGEWSIEAWAIDLGDGCLDSNDNPARCFIAEPSFNESDFFNIESTNLNVSGLSPSSSNPDFIWGISLSGSLVAEQDLNITGVSTWLQTAPNSTQPTQFTGKNLETSIVVADGQSVAVTVEITFG